MQYGKCLLEEHLEKYIMYEEIMNIAILRSPKYCSRRSTKMKRVSNMSRIEQAMTEDMQLIIPRSPQNSDEVQK